MFSFFNTRKRVYLDHAGATPVSRKSLNALKEMLSLFGNPSAIHQEGVSASKLFDKARAMCAKAVNAHAYEIYFTSTGTESCNLAILGTYFGFATSYKPQANDLPHIITSSIEHPAVLEPIRQLEKEKKITVTYVPVYEDGVVKASDIRKALSENTILVSVMYANNEIGTLQPAKEIGRVIEEWKKENNRSHTSYPYFHIDACQAGNYCNLDVVRLRAHLMTLNSSKVYGPKGIALLYKREGITVEGILFGGGQERGLRSGTEDVAGAYAFAVALDESQRIKDEESSRLREIRDYFKELAEKEIPEIVFYGAWDEYWLQATGYKLKAEKRLPNNINCRVPGITSEEMILRLDAAGFACSHKSACASAESDGSYVLQALGATEQESLENIRITLGRFTTKKDMERLVGAMKSISSKYANR